MDKKQLTAKLFILICSIGAICLCSFRIYKYGLNDDSTLVDYKKFTETKDYVFPTVSFCLCNMFLDDRLASYAVNSSAYTKFLRGELYEEGMLNIDYQQVTTDMSDITLKAIEFILEILV